MSKLKTLTYLLLSIFLLSACKSKKSGATSSNIKGLEQVDFNFFSSKLKIDYSDSNQSIGLNASLRMEKDKVVWMSVIGPFGVKVGKLKLTQDSILILQDYPDRTYSAYSVNEFNRKSGTDISVKQVQNLLLGNLLFDNKSKVVTEDNRMVVKQSAGSFSIINFLEGNKIKEVNVSSSAQQGAINLVYDDYVKHSGKTIPEKANLDVKNTSFSANVQMQHKNVNFTNDKLDFPFTVSDKYVRK